ncbi:zinc finger protein 385B isoform X2 [Nerophis ophidion]|uniref:zinc finger protein 385B isoform X2 n=1 Tax=Nerophis ophidion TaxID=159077 RepID=UPI002ADFB324|nr:zinc finger protein 385B isoform X2 [Nerophis ophidion]
MKTLRSHPFLEGRPTFNLVGACPQRMDTPAVGSAAEQTTAAGSAYSLCDVCNLQLTSAAQAQLHYNARSHLRRVRQMKAGGMGGQVAAGGPSKLLPLASGLRCLAGQVQTSEPSAPLCSTTGGAGGPSVLMKPFLPFPVDAVAPVALFPNFNTMDPVQKAVIKHTFGGVAAKRKQVITCSVCRLRFNSDSQAASHFRGGRHAKKVKSQENKTNGSGSRKAGPAHPMSTNQHTEVAPSSPSSSRAGSETPPPSPAPTLPQEAPPTAECEEERAKQLMYCSLCKVAVNSLSQLQAHNAGEVGRASVVSSPTANVYLPAGSKHKTMLDARSGAGPIKSYPRPGAKPKTCNAATTVKGSGLQNKTFHCQTCDVHVNSEIQLKQHITSRRHKDRVAGKPSKSKHSPHNNNNNNMRTQHSSLMELAKSPFLRPPPFTSSLPPGPPPSLPLLAASFLRQAPGQIRTRHPSLLFAPY